jgi:hypothetical protein
MELVSLVLCVVRAVYKFDFRLDTNETRYKRRLVERRSHLQRLMLLTGGPR